MCTSTEAQTANDSLHYHYTTEVAFNLDRQASTHGIYVQTTLEEFYLRAYNYITNININSHTLKLKWDKNCTLRSL